MKDMLIGLVLATLVSSRYYSGRSGVLPESNVVSWLGQAPGAVVVNECAPPNPVRHPSLERSLACPISKRTHLVSILGIAVAMSVINSKPDVRGWLCQRFAVIDLSHSPTPPQLLCSKPPTSLSSPK
jgi:hypothetical protein